MTYREIRKNWQHRFGWDSVLVDAWALIWSPFVTKICLKLKLIPNVITLMMIAGGLVGGVLFFIPGLGFKIAGAVFIHLWYVFDCSDGEVARITKRYSKFGTEIDYTAHVLDHPVMMVGFAAAVCQAEIGIDSFIILLVFAATAVLDLIFRSMATFGLIYDLKLPPEKSSKEHVFTKREKIRFFIGCVVHLPNLALIFPLVYFICPKIAFYYVCAVLAGLCLYVPVVALAWLKRIVRI